jgi:integrase
LSEVKRFLERQLSEGVWSENTALERERLLLRIGRDLKAAGIQLRPASISVTDIRKYINWLADTKRNSTTQCKALLLLSDFLLKEADNMAGMKMKKQFPPETQTDTTRPAYEELLKGFDTLEGIEDDWVRALARGQAALFIGTLVRPSEGRKAIYGDLNRKAWKLLIRHPKGKTREREVEFLDSRCIREMENFLKERAETLQFLEYDPEDPNLPLFPSINVKSRLAGGKHPVGIFSSQAFNRAWKLAFPSMEHYCARRGMAQHFVDKDPRLLPAVSKVLGHRDLRTTMQYYSQVRMDKACSELRKILVPQTAPKAQTGPESPPSGPQDPRRREPNPVDPMFS